MEYDKQTQTEKTYSYRDLIDLDKLQYLQDKLHLVTGADICMLDPENKLITKISGDCLDLDAPHLHNLMQDLFKRTSDGSLEEQAVVDLSGMGFQLAAIAIRMNEKVLMKVLVVDRQRKGEAFSDLLDLIREAARTLLIAKAQCVEALAQHEKSRSAIEELSVGHVAMKAITEIEHLLDSDEPLNDVLEKLLNIVERHLQTTHSQILQVRADGNLDLVASKPLGVASVLKVPLLKTSRFPDEKPLILSSQTKESKDMISALAIDEVRAMMVFPVLKEEDAPRLYLCLAQMDRDRNWTLQDVKFLVDTTRIMHDIFITRMEKNTQA